MYFDDGERPMDVEPTVVAIISEMTRIPAALKSWRTVLVDLLNDNRVFNSDPEDGSKWRPIVKALYHSDKSAFSELLSEYLRLPSFFVHVLSDISRQGRGGTICEHLYEQGI